MIVAKLYMVSFFKVSAPEICIQKKINKQNREEIPFLNNNSKIEIFDNNITIENNNQLFEDVFCIDKINKDKLFKNNKEISGSNYLFSGKIEIHKIKSIKSTDGGILKDGLILNIKNYTGELVGTINYDYLYCNGIKCIDLSNKNSIKFIKTINQLKDEIFEIYVNYENNDKIVLKMELCPGDEEILNNCLKNYEDNVNYIL